nr:hypothetical protein GCM10020092_102180 [Actinoplanes digitatis]
MQAGQRVQLVLAEQGADPLRHAVGAAVPVVHRIAEQRSGRVQQPVVHRPRVDADPVDRSGTAESVEDAAVQREDVPVQRPADPHRLVGEAVDRRERHGAGLDAADHDAPA